MTSHLSMDGTSAEHFQSQDADGNLPISVGKLPLSVACPI